MEWDHLRNEIRRCVRCDLSFSRRHALPGEGNTGSKIFLIAQAPGPVENLSGKMFTGPSGKLLDELLEEAGLSREEVYMSNLVKCFLPKCRRPSRGEIQACSPYLLREIEMVRPEIIVPMGFHATRFIFTHFDIPRPQRTEYHTLFGKAFRVPGTLLYPLRHPTALLFNPGMRHQMKSNYRGLKKIRESI